MVIRFFSIAFAIVLLCAPPFLIYEMTVPVEQFRKGTYVDFLTFAGAIAVVYGDV